MLAAPISSVVAGGRGNVLDLSDAQYPERISSEFWGRAREECTVQWWRGDGVDEEEVRVGREMQCV